MRNATRGSRRRLNVAVMCSQRAPGLVHLLNTDTRRGIDYDIVCCISSSDTFAEEVRVERRGVPCLPHSIRRFCALRGVNLHDREARHEYDTIALDLLAPFNPDLLILLDYRLLLTPAILDAFAGPVISIQQGDPVHQREGTPSPPGSGWRITSHVVTGRPSEGRTVLRSWDISSQTPTETVTAWSAMLRRTIGVVTDLVDRPGSPLNLDAAGPWDLDEEGAMVTMGTHAGRATAAAGVRRR